MFELICGPIITCNIILRPILINFHIIIYYYKHEYNQHRFIKWTILHTPFWTKVVIDPMNCILVLLKTDKKFSAALKFLTTVLIYIILLFKLIITHLFKYKIIYLNIWHTTLIFTISFCVDKYLKTINLK